MTQPTTHGTTPELAKEKAPRGLQAWPTVTKLVTLLLVCSLLICETGIWPRSSFLLNVNIKGNYTDNKLNYQTNAVIELHSSEMFT